MTAPDGEPVEVSYKAPELGVELSLKINNPTANDATAEERRWLESAGHSFALAALSIFRSREVLESVHSSVTGELFGFYDRLEAEVGSMIFLREKATSQRISQLLQEWKEE